jgi:cell division protein ZapA
MANEPNPVIITILGKEYRIACPPEERAGLEASARYLDKKMREIRDRGRTAGGDNIAIMAALNITHELLQKEAEEQPEKYDNSLSGRVKQLQNKIETALSSARQIEI